VNTKTCWCFAILCSIITKITKDKWKFIYRLTTISFLIFWINCFFFFSRHFRTLRFFSTFEHFDLLSICSSIFASSIFVLTTRNLQVCFVLFSCWYFDLNSFSLFFWFVILFLVRFFLVCWSNLSHHHAYHLNRVSMYSQCTRRHLSSCLKDDIVDWTKITWDKM
jgi:hypothetical protein